MGKGKRLVLFAILGVLVFTGCSPFPGKKLGALKGTSWMLVSYDSKLPIPGSNMTLEFSENEVRGSASCNHYFGSYKIRGDEVSITGLGWTEMACLDPEGIMEQEQILMGLLSMAAGFNIAGNTLHITTSTGEVLTFEKSSMGE